MGDDTETDEEREARWAEFEQHRAKFYQLIGHCVTMYQSVEDYLPDVFAAALGGDKERASAMFAVARGLEAKLDLITATLVGRSDDLATYWPGLLKRVAKAAAARNEIAHASPVHHGGGVLVIMDPENKKPTRAIRQGKDRMELRKQTKSGETIWTLEMMRDEYNRADKLFGNLIAFVKMLAGEEPPEHLLDGLVKASS